MAGEINAPLGGWTTYMPSPGDAGGGGIGGDWRYPSMNADPRLLPASAPAPALAVRPRILRQPAPAAIASAAATSPGPTGATGPNGPTPATPVQGNPFFNFLTSLFGHGGNPPQGMTGLLASRGQGGRSTDTLGNPFNRFG